LNDFKSGKYWVRIGQADKNAWTYSGVFDFEGKGTVSELKLAGKEKYKMPFFFDSSHSSSSLMGQ
jgi:hypothetical protein